MHDSENLRKLTVTLPTPDMHAVDASEDFVARDKDLLQKLFRFSYELASIRCWSQMQFAVQIPHLLAMVHHENHDLRWEAMERADTTWQAFLLAERLVHVDKDPQALRKGGLQDCLKEAAWHQLQLARESYCICRNAHWDPRDAELRLFSWLMYGRPANTKFMLEDVFAHLADISRRHAKNETMQRCLEPQVGSLHGV